MRSSGVRLADSALMRLSSIKHRSKWVRIYMFIGLALALLHLQSGLAADEWLKDEVLKQLSELRQDNRNLHRELEALKKQSANERNDEKRFLRLSLSELIGDKPIIGKPKAKIIVAEFTDYECPFCKKFSLTSFPQIRKTYIDTGKIQYVVRDFPLGIHSSAKSAAIAANCAGQQHRYWGMKARLFEHQNTLGRELYERQATELKLDIQKYRTCLEDMTVAAAVERDVAFGNRAGVQATPTFLVGRISGNSIKDLKAVSGAMAFETFSELLDEMVKLR